MDILRKSHETKIIDDLSSFEIGTKIVNFTGIPLKKAIDITEKIPWKRPPYAKQSWGNWIHRMASYSGRIKPAFAHWLIKLFTTERDVILDPFCGIGTIPLEANLLNRKSIGIDLNPYAYLISKAKMDRKPLEEYLNYLDSIRLDFTTRKDEKVPEWVKSYYNPDTLNEILHLVPKLEKDKQYFILGCLLGIAQGHRKGHLSKPSGNIVPYKPKPDVNNEYRPAIPILKRKVERICKNGFNFDPKGEIYLDDARKLPIESNSIDVIISSPPYFNTLDYVSVNRLRLEIMGINEEKRGELKNVLIQDYKNYLIEMEKCVKEMKRVLKNNSKCILILGDLHNRKNVINTAEEVGKLMESLGFKTHAIIDDEIPFGIPPQRKDPNKRLDRIMITTLKK